MLRTSSGRSALRSVAAWLARFLLAVLLIVVQAAWASASPGATATNGGRERPYLPQLAWYAVLWAVVYAVARWKKRDPETWLAWTFVFTWLPLAVLLFKKRRIG